MAIEVYCTDQDLVEQRVNILSLGVASWENQRKAAFNFINRVVKLRWYEDAAKQLGYDPNVDLFSADKVRAGSLKNLSVFKTLEFAYAYLKKEGSEKDSYERLEESFRRKYSEELDLILAEGIDYDWTSDGQIDSLEKSIRAPRRLKRG